MTVLFFVGPPGVGKTTLVRALLGDILSYTDSPKWTLAQHAIAAGHYTGGTFDGADTVPYNGVKTALAFWEQRYKGDPRPTILDGDRFSNEGVLKWFRDQGAEARVVYLDAPAEVLDARRRERGSNQNASWLKGRGTKAERFAGMFLPEHRLSIGNTLLPSFVQSLVRDWIAKTP